MPGFGPTVDATTRKRAAFLTRARYQAGEVGVGQADGGLEAASSKVVGDDEHRAECHRRGDQRVEESRRREPANGDQLIVSIRRPAICLIALPAVLNRLASDLPF